MALGEASTEDRVVLPRAVTLKLLSMCCRFRDWISPQKWPTFTGTCGISRLSRAPLYTSSSNFIASVSISVPRNPLSGAKSTIPGTAQLRRICSEFAHIVDSLSPRLSFSIHPSSMYKLIHPCMTPT